MQSKGIASVSDHRYRGAEDPIRLFYICKGRVGYQEARRSHRLREVCMLIGVHPGEQDELPDAGCEQSDEDGHAQNSQPFAAVSRGLSGQAVVANILRKAGPVGFLAICKSAGAVAGFEAFEPKWLIELEGTKVTANEAFAEDATGKLAEVTGFDVEQLSDRELC